MEETLKFAIPLLIAAIAREIEKRRYRRRCRREWEQEYNFSKNGQSK